MTKEQERKLAKALILEDCGTPEKQKEDLVDAILDIFGTPDRWPLTDAERTDVLKRLFKMATNIRRSE